MIVFFRALDWGRSQLADSTKIAHSRGHASRGGGREYHVSISTVPGFEAGWFALLAVSLPVQPRDTRFASSCFHFLLALENPAQGSSGPIIGKE